MRHALMTQARMQRRAAAVAAVAGCLLVARRINRWGATAQEVARVLPGDQEVGDPALATTRATSIRARAEAVWPWLAQLGWHRAGWYSYDAIDNDHLASADHLVPALQGGLQVGDFVPEGPNVGWTVTARPVTPVGGEEKQATRRYRPRVRFSLEVVP